MGRYPRSRGGERVAKRDGAAMDVETLARQRQLTLDRAGLGREGFVYFNQVHVFHGQPCLRQSCPRCRNWANSHHRWIDPCYAPRHQSSERLELSLARKLLAGDDHRGCSVADARRISGRNDASLSKNGFERAQLFRCRVWSHVLVGRELFHFPSPWIWNRNRNNFVAEHSLVPCSLRELLRAKREFVDASTIEVISFSQILRGFRHSESDVGISQSLPEHVLHHRSLAEWSPPPDTPGDVRCLGHGLGATDETELRIA